MKLTRTIIAICLCMVAVAGFAQKATNNPFFRFATKAEAQMLITDIDEYTNGWNQFDICSRLQNKEGGRIVCKHQVRKETEQETQCNLKRVILWIIVKIFYYLISL